MGLSVGESKKPAESAETIIRQHQINVGKYTIPRILWVCKRYVNSSPDFLMRRIESIVSTLDKDEEKTEDLWLPKRCFGRCSLQVSIFEYWRPGGLPFWELTYMPSWDKEHHLQKCRFRFSAGLFEEGQCRENYFETLKIFLEKTAAMTGCQSMTNCSVVNFSSFHCLTLCVFDVLGFPLEH